MNRFALLVSASALAAQAGSFPVKTAEPVQFSLTFRNPGAPLHPQSLAADGEGFIWLAASTGLYRFDGAHFHLAHPE